LARKVLRNHTNLFGFLKIAQTNPYETIALLGAKSHSFTQLEGDLCQFLARSVSEYSPVGEVFELKLTG